MADEEVVQTVDWTELHDLLERDVEERSGFARQRRALVGLALACWAGSFALVAVTWNGVAERDIVALQVPILVSGGFSAIVLAIVGGALFVAAALGASRPGGDARRR